MCFDSILVRLKARDSRGYRFERTTGRFDSILVRLKGGLSGYSDSVCHIKREFRFHTGSIKRSVTRWAGLVDSVFRFHTGSIKRTHTLCDRLSFSFDSILVRLKGFGRPATVIDAVSVEFRFHTGSIKSRAVDPSPYSRSGNSFDSILVRLKVSSPYCSGSIVHTLFRFHTGSIKRTVVVCSYS